jgi:dolichyl-diphosphooligosaccharide--protein glycosyltransferase
MTRDFRGEVSVTAAGPSLPCTGTRGVSGFISQSDPGPAFTAAVAAALVSLALAAFCFQKCSTYMGARHAAAAAALLVFCAAAVAVRLVVVWRHGPLIGEFDPWFNVRATRHLVTHGAHAFHNWFDDQSWYPHGRAIGATIYPGLMATAAAAHAVAHALGFAPSVDAVCIYLPPCVAALTVLAAYGMTAAAWDRGAALFAAFFIALVPAYASRSVAGFFDNEAVAIFAIAALCAAWVRSIDTGSTSWAMAAAASYCYLVASWGGFIYFTNLLPLHVLVLLLMGRFSSRLYTAYSVWFCFGTLFATCTPMVGFATVRTTEFALSTCVFACLQWQQARSLLRRYLPPRNLASVDRAVSCGAAPAAVVLLGALMAAGRTPALTGRLLRLVGWATDAGGATDSVLVQSVSEHQPTPWSTFFFDFHVTLVFAPVGMHALFRRLSNTDVFLILYATSAAYFAATMVRLVLILAPIVCVCAGIGASETAATLWTGRSADARAFNAAACPRSRDRAPSESAAQHAEHNNPSGMHTLWNGVARLASIGLLAALLALFAVHCAWATAFAYSTPSIVAHTTLPATGVRVRIDDFREAFAWLRAHTPTDSKIAAWWDYGYHIGELANRTTLIDNNTRNATHIALVGLALVSPETRAARLLRRLGATHVLVVCGGATGHYGDDVSKMRWPARLASAVAEASVGERSAVIEADFVADDGEVRVDARGGPAMRAALAFQVFRSVWIQRNAMSLSAVTIHPCFGKNNRIEYPRYLFRIPNKNSNSSASQCLFLVRPVITLNSTPSACAAVLPPLPHAAHAPQASARI